MRDGPDFLDLPARDCKPRLRGLTHVLDKGTTIPELEAVLAGVGHLTDVFKIGQGISYVDRTVKERVALCGAADSQDRWCGRQAWWATRHGTATRR
jgi:phosphosulfolactate synthase